MEELQIVLKIAERCNLNCTYCYYYNMGDDSSATRPSLLKRGVLDDLCSFIVEGLESYDCKKLNVFLHGGEPLLYPQPYFDHLCASIQAAVAGRAELSFVMQTNALLVDEEWIELLGKYKVGVGVSLDGPADVHDHARLDHKGRGSYHATIQALGRLRAAAAKGKLSEPGALAVLGTTHEGGRVYRHLVHDLGFRTLDFLLPDLGREEADADLVDRCTAFLADAFDAWWTDDNPSIHVRIFDQILGGLVRDLPPGWRERAVGSNPVITVYADGSLGPQDFLRWKVPHLFRKDMNLRGISLRDFLGSPAFDTAREAARTLPAACEPCPWRRPCGGGQLVNRMGPTGNVDGESVFCATLTALYEQAVVQLIRRGYSIEALRGRLLLDESAEAAA